MHETTSRFKTHVGDAAKLKVALVTMVENYEELGVSVPSFVGNDRGKALNVLRNANTQIILDELVFNAESAIHVASRVRGVDCDLLVFNVIGWGGGDAAVIIGQSFAQIPLVLWTTPTLRMALCGVFEVASDLRSIGRGFKLIVGKDERSKEQMECVLRAVKVVKKLKGMRIGQIGYPPPGFVDATAHELDLTARLGLKVVRLDTSDIFRQLETVRDDVFLNALQIRRDTKLPEEQLRRSIKMSIALENVVKQNRLVGGALRCMPELQQYAFPCLGVSKLSDAGLPVACEGDLPAAITLVILQDLAGSPAAVFDCDSLEMENNVMRFWHCGHLPPRMAKSEGDVRITVPTYFNQVLGPGAVVSLAVKPGVVTLAKLDPRGERMFMAKGEAIVSKQPVAGSSAAVKFKMNVGKMLRLMVTNGVEHHLCLTHGDVMAELREFCEILRISILECA